MAKYIPLDAVVAEIKKRINFNRTLNAHSRLDECKAILSFIDTLEVKEVDLEKEINTYISNNFFGSETMGFFAARTKEEPNDQDIALCAKHFFELGLRASQPTTYVYGIEEALKENGIDPDSKEADMYRAIYKIYDRLKSLKGK